MRGEGRQAHLDRLLVADVGEEPVEDGQGGRCGRRAQARLVEQRRQAERLQRDGLAARVRPADHERAQSAEVEVDRYGSGRVEQRMPCADDRHFFGPLDRRPAPAPRDRPACDGEVDRRGRLDQRDERCAFSPNGRRQLAKDPFDLVALGRRGLRLAVGQLDDLERLDEQGLPRAGCVVDDAANAAPRARLQREHGATAALGDEVLLQVLAQPGSAREPAQLVEHALLAGAQLLAERGAGVARRYPAGRSRRPRRGGRSPSRSAKLRIDRRCDLGQQRSDPPLRSRDDRARRPPEIVAEILFSASGASTPPRPATRPASDVVDPSSGGSGELVDQRDRLGGHRLTSRDLVGVGRGHERRASAAPNAVEVAARDPLDDRGELEPSGRPRSRFESTSANARPRGAARKTVCGARDQGTEHLAAPLPLTWTWPESRTRAMPRGDVMGSPVAAYGFEESRRGQRSIGSHDRSPGLGSCPVRTPRGSRGPRREGF